MLSDCMRMFADQLESHWTTGDGPGGYLCTNIGIRALFHVIKDVADHTGRSMVRTSTCSRPTRRFQRFLHTYRYL